MYVGIFCFLIYRARFPSDFEIMSLHVCITLLYASITRINTMWMKKCVFVAQNLLPFQLVNIISFT